MFTIENRILVMESHCLQLRNVDLVFQTNLTCSQELISVGPFTSVLQYLGSFCSATCFDTSIKTRKLGLASSNRCRGVGGVVVEHADSTQGLLVRFLRVSQ